MSNLLPLTSQLYEYILANSLKEPKPLEKLHAQTKTMSEARMMTMPDQAQFIYFLLKLIRAKKIIEIGVFTGYCTGWMAYALEDQGKIIGCDIDEEWPSIGKKYWEELGVANKIDLKIGNALDTLDQLLLDQANTFDAIFIDADKLNYTAYYEKSLKLVRQGGLILFDNLLWSGKVADLTAQDASTIHLRSLTKNLHQDERIYFSLVTIADGMGLALKK
jgi:predicted O-methyltransferase YrrM